MITTRKKSYVVGMLCLHGLEPFLADSAKVVGVVDQMMVQEMIENEEVAEALKDLFPDFSYVKRKRKPKKD